MSEGVKSGLVNAVNKGKVLGRTSGTTLSNEKILKKHSKLSRDIQRGLSLTEYQRIHGVSRNTVIKVKRCMVA